MKIDEITSGDEITTCEEIDELAQVFADHIATIFKNRPTQARLQIHFYKRLADAICWPENSSYGHMEPNFLTGETRISLRLIDAARSLLAEAQK